MFLCGRYVWTTDCVIYTAIWFIRLCSRWGHFTNNDRDYNDKIKINCMLLLLLLQESLLPFPVMYIENIVVLCVF